MKKVEQLLTIVIAVVVGLIIVGTLLPVGMDEFYSADTSGWDSAEQSIFDLLPVFFILAILGVAIGWLLSTFKR